MIPKYSVKSKQFRTLIILKFLCGLREKMKFYRVEGAISSRWLQSGDIRVLFPLVLEVVGNKGGDNTDRNFAPLINPKFVTSLINPPQTPEIWRVFQSGKLSRFNENADRRRKPRFFF